MTVLTKNGWIPHDVENNDSLDVWQINNLSVHLQKYIFPQILGQPSTDHLLQGHLDIDCLVVQPGVELVGLVLPLGVEGITEVGVQAYAKVVVHDKDLERMRCHIEFILTNTAFTIHHTHTPPPHTHIHPF